MPQTPLEEVLADMKAMREIGETIPDAAFDYARNNVAEIEEFRISMKVHEITDYILSVVR